MAKPAEIACPVERYARDVAEGRIVAGRLVRLACARHLRDLVDGPARGLRWDAAAAARVLNFFSFLRLPADGELDGKAFSPEGFQCFILGSLFGWKNRDGKRRFRTAFIEQGKGNGKSPLAAGVGLYGLCADGEPAAEIYSAATTAFQAGILFRDARRMVEASPALRDRLDVGQHNLAYPATDSFFRPVSAEHRQLSGPRPHMALLDEIHEHPTPLVVDKLRAGTKSRRQALIFEITNSGHDRTTVCWAHHEYSVKVLEAVVENDAWFAYVCTLDPCESCREEGFSQPKDGCPDCDDWKDESVWLKANPGLDAILPRAYLREQVEEAKGMPSKEGIVRRLNFCVWTDAVTRAIPMDAWDQCGRVALTRYGLDPSAAGTPAYRAAFEKTLAGDPCYAGLDIGATSDFTALSLLFPHGDAELVELPADDAGGEPRRITRRSFTRLNWYWLPERPRRRDEKMAAVIDGWRKAGWIRTTPGEVVDYDLVLEDLKAIAERFCVLLWAIDRGFQGCQMATNLMKCFGDEAVVAFAQGIVSMSPPFREFLELTILGRLYHDLDPVTRWMASNCAAETRGGLTKPSKEASTEKIDGITSAVMALGVALSAPEPQQPSIEVVSW